MSIEAFGVNFSGSDGPPLFVLSKQTTTSFFLSQWQQTDERESERYRLSLLD